MLVLGFEFQGAFVLIGVFSSLEEAEKGVRKFFDSLQPEVIEMRDHSIFIRTKPISTTLASNTWWFVEISICGLNEPLEAPEWMKENK